MRSIHSKTRESEADVNTAVSESAYSLLALYSYATDRFAAEEMELSGLQDIIRRFLKDQVDFYGEVVRGEEWYRRCASAIGVSSVDGDALGQDTPVAINTATETRGDE